MTQTTSLVIIAVIYNSYPDTVRFVESISRCFDNEVKLILVDNSEIEPPSFFIEKIQHYDFITYLKSKKNVGYFQGARSGLMHFFENNHGYPQWIIVCNVDIIFETREILKKLGSCENIPGLGVIAPAIISKQWKADMNPFLIRKVSLKRISFLRKIYSNVLLHNGYVLLHYVKKILKMMMQRIPFHRNGNGNSSRNIYAPHGSCIIFNKNYFETGGTLDHFSFLFGEEIFVGETAKRLGLKVLYLPELQVCHYEHSSIGNFITSKINKYYKQSIEDILRHYYQSVPSEANGL